MARRERMLFAASHLRSSPGMANAEHATLCVDDVDEEDKPHIHRLQRLEGMMRADDIGDRIG